MKEGNKCLNNRKGNTMKGLFISVLFILLLNATGAIAAENTDWYTAFFASRDSSYRGGAAADVRVKLTLINKLNVFRKECPVVIPRIRMPLPDNYSEWITVVDPDLPPGDREENGAFLLSQLDDIDKDGIWDELFFQVDMKPREKKTVYIYIVQNMIDTSKHYTHAEIGMYGKHLMPWWESEHIGWKLWYADSCDMYGKRSAKLTANIMDTNHYGHDTPYEVGADIMWVRNTFGAGGMCLFEYPDNPDSLSRPRFSPFKGQGPVSDTRYAYDVVLNGPIRSMIRAHTMQWRTDKGAYELEQYYTSYRNKNYYTCKVRFLSFIPQVEGVQLGCGIRRLENESLQYQKGGIAITGTDNLRSYLTPNEGDPDLKGGIEQFLGIGLVVKDMYKPKFHHTKIMGENYAFIMPLTDDLSYEFLAAGAWSEGAVVSSEKEFKKYIIATAREYNNPLILDSLTVEHKK